MTKVVIGVGTIKIELGWDRKKEIGTRVTRRWQDLGWGIDDPDLGPQTTKKQDRQICAHLAQLCGCSESSPQKDRLGMFKLFSCWKKTFCFSISNKRKFFITLSKYILIYMWCKYYSQIIQIFFITFKNIAKIYLEMYLLPCRRRT